MSLRDHLQELKLPDSLITDLVRVAYRRMWEDDTTRWPDREFPLATMECYRVALLTAVWSVMRTQEMLDHVYPDQPLRDWFEKGKDSFTHALVEYESRIRKAYPYWKPTIDYVKSFRELGYGPKIVDAPASEKKEDGKVRPVGPVVRRKRKGVAVRRRRSN